MSRSTPSLNRSVIHYQVTIEWHSVRGLEASLITFYLWPSGLVVLKLVLSGLQKHPHEL